MPLSQPNREGRTVTKRMCPCGNCNATWDQAVRDLMNGPAAMNRDQAEERLEAMVERQEDKP